MKNILLTLGAAALLVACARQDDVGGTDTIQTDTRREVSPSPVSIEPELTPATSTTPTTATPAPPPLLPPDSGATSTRDTGSAIDNSGREDSLSTPAINTNDEGLSQSVRTAMGIDSDASGSIQVSVNQGVVTLTGTVSSEEEKQQLEAKAKAVSGVSSVDNKLEIKSGEQSPK